MEFPKWVVDRVIARQGVLHPYDSLDAQRTAFVVVDLQNYFTRPGFQGYCESAAGVIPIANRLATYLREKGGLVVWIQTSADGAEQFWSHHHRHMLSPERCERRLQQLSSTHEGYQLHPEVDAQPDDPRVSKRCYSAFTPGSSNLHEVLQHHGIDTLLIGGTATNVCCESTARDAMMMDYRCIMVADALASFTEEEHVWALNQWMLYFGDVLESHEVIERLDQEANTPVPLHATANG